MTHAIVGRFLLLLTVTTFNEFVAFSYSAKQSHLNVYLKCPLNLSFVSK